MRRRAEKVDFLSYFFFILTGSVFSRKATLSMFFFMIGRSRVVLTFREKRF